MQIFSDPDRDIATSKPTPGSYEWWYFDAISHDGMYTIVVIFYEGNPFSRRYIDAIENGVQNNASGYPAMSISIYKEGSPLFYSFEEVPPADAEFSSDLPAGKVKKNMFRRNRFDDHELVYHLELNQTIPNGDRLSGELIFRTKGRNSKTGFMGGGQVHMDDNHQWNLVQPSAVVEGELQIKGYKEESIQFRGRGYHDHNTGMEPMKKSFNEWYWGRFHFSGHTLVYYLMSEQHGRRNCAWLIDSAQNTKELKGEIELLDSGLNVFGLRSARKIEMDAGDTGFLIQQGEILDDGPFYQRFSSRLMYKMDGELYQANGISEYIRPGRIYTKLFRPLVNMRIQYPDKTHWVQKSPRLYRWTW